jgi:hypothetical protein
MPSRPPAKPVTIVDPTRLPPAESEKELSSEQKQIRDLEHRLALAEGKREVAPTFVEQPPSEDKVLIHFVDDGLTAGGVTWYRGQEVEFTPGTQEWKDATDTRGNPWFLLTESEQYERFGKLHFRRGPWPGKSFSDIDPRDYLALNMTSGDGQLPLVEREEIAKAAELEKNRRRAAPRLAS